MNEKDLRDIIAMVAMINYMRTTENDEAVNSGLEFEELVAVKSYMMADAMLFERKETR